MSGHMGFLGCDYYAAIEGLRKLIPLLPPSDHGRSMLNWNQLANYGRSALLLLIAVAADPWVASQNPRIGLTLSVTVSDENGVAVTSAQLFLLA